MHDVKIKNQKSKIKTEDLGLEQYVFDTIRYFDIFEMPVTAVQIWRSLVVDRVGTGVRWHGQHAVSLRQVRETLQQSSWLRARVKGKWGYWALGGSAKAAGGMRRYVRQRLMRHILAQYKWKIARGVMRGLIPLPFVRMVGVTGSLALWHARPQSDFDLFIIVRRGRIWTARLLLMLVTQLWGRRRKYWEGEAPDKVCLNHYITDDALLMAPQMRSMYTAMLYARLIPVFGLKVYRRWLAINGTWIRRWLMYPALPRLASRQVVHVSYGMRVAKRWVEGFLLEPIGGVLERQAEKLQRVAIDRHKWRDRGGRVKVSNKELAFHPYSKEAHVLHRFVEEYGQGRLL